jgi:hypothetical protein
MTKSSKNPKKRNRPSLSCNYCKKRKVKCDRNRPCSSCIKYNVGDLCTYPDEDIAGVHISENSFESTSPAENSGVILTFAVNSNVSSNQGAQSKFEEMQSKFYQDESDEAESNRFLEGQKEPLGFQQTFPPEQRRPHPPQVIPPQYQQNHNAQIISHPKEYQNSHQAQNGLAPLSTLIGAPSEVQSQLDMLKAKIKEIETSFGISATSSSASAFSSSLATRGEPPLKLPKTSTTGPVKLPPISWNQYHTPASTSLQDYESASSKLLFPHRNDTSPHIHKIDWESLRYNPDQNPTYIGSNPYPSEEETINFYDSYTPIHIKDSSRRTNNGPFAWLSLMKMDPGTLKLLKFMRSTQLEFSRYLQQAPLVLPTGEKDIPPPSPMHFKPMVTPSGVQPVVMKTQDAELAFREKAIDQDGYNDIRLYGNMKLSEMRTPIDQKKDQKQAPNGDKGTHTPSEEDTNSEKSKMNAPKEGGFVKGDVQRKLMNKHAISLGLTFYEGQIDQELHLIEKIKMILPKQKVIWKLINKFFSQMYPFLPFLDEEYFKADMEKILGPEGFMDAKIEKLSIEKRLDLANIGILLIVIRFAYLSLFSNRNGVNENNLNSVDPSPAAQELKYLLSNPINIDLIDMAQLCLDQFDLMRKSNLVVLQCAFFMRLYQIFAPEDGDGADGGYSQVFNGVLVQMAYSMGINREPDNFSDVCNDGRLNNVARKIWFFMLVTDLIQAYHFGNPMSINEKYFDTKQPYYKSGNENIKDVEMEKWVISTFAYFDNYYKRLTNILDTCLDIKKSTRMPYLISLINDFEIALNTNYGTLKQYLVPFKQETYHFPFIKIMKCKTYINMKVFSMTLFTHLYLYYERKNNVDFAYFYLKKNFSIICGEFIPGFFELIVNNYINFGEGADLILNPTVEFSIHRVGHFIFACLIKLNLTIFRMKNKEDHLSQLRENFSYNLRFTKFSKLSKMLEKIIRYCIGAMSRLSQRYYYAWRVTKAQQFLLKIISGEEFYKFCLDQDEVKFLDLNFEQIDELTNISETALKKFGKTKIFPVVSDLLESINGEDLEFSHPSSRHRDVSTPPQQIPKPPTPSFPKTPSVSTEMNRFPNGTLGSESTGSEYDDFQFIENPEIDLLWFQMANMKSDLNGTSNLAEGSTVANEFGQTPRPRAGSWFSGANNITTNAGYSDLPSMSLFATPLSPATATDNLGVINVNRFSSFLDGYEIFNSVDSFIGLERDKPDLL